MEMNPSTPGTAGRQITRLSNAPTTANLLLSRKKSIPSKWDDADKWLTTTTSSSSFHDSPSSTHHASVCVQSSKFSRFGTLPKSEEEEEDDDDEVSTHNNLSSETLLLQDKFLSRASNCDALEPKGTNKATYKVQCRDIGTSCDYTPVKMSSPQRHNTPLDASGHLDSLNSLNFDISELKDFHFAKLQLSANWSKKDEDLVMEKGKEPSSKLKYFDNDVETRKNSTGRRDVYSWKDEEKVKICIRYQREEEKIEAWVRLQRAKAEEQSSKLELKIQRMRSNLEEKLMKKMAAVDRKAEEWRAEARLRHSQQMIKASEHHAKKLNNKQKFQV